MAGSSITVNVTSEEHPLLVVERMMHRAVKHLVSAEARILDETQTVLDANLHDGDVLQAVMMPDEEIVSNLVQQIDDQLRGTREFAQLMTTYHAGEYAIFKFELKEFLRQDDARVVHILYHLPSWRHGPLLITSLAEDFGGHWDGYGLIFVGGQEIEVIDYSNFNSYHHDLGKCAGKCEIASRMNLGTLLEEHQAVSQTQIDLLLNRDDEGKGKGKGKGDYHMCQGWSRGERKIISPEEHH